MHAGWGHPSLPRKYLIILQDPTKRHIFSEAIPRHVFSLPAIPCLLFIFLMVHAILFTLIYLLICLFVWGSKFSNIAGVDLELVYLPPPPKKTTGVCHLAWFVLCMKPKASHMPGEHSTKGSYYRVSQAALQCVSLLPESPVC